MNPYFVMCLMMWYLGQNYMVIELILARADCENARAVFNYISSKTFYAPPPPDRRSGGILFCPVFHSVLLSETLTLLITFEQSFAISRR